MSLATVTWLLSNKWLSRGAEGNEPFFFGISDCIDFEMPINNQAPLLTNMWTSAFVGHEDDEDFRSVYAE